MKKGLPPVSTEESGFKKMTGTSGFADARGIAA